MTEATAEDRSAAQALADKHNAGIVKPGANMLLDVVGRIENLETDKSAIAEDIKEIYTEAKSNGFDTKALRRIIRERKRDRAEVEEEQAIVDTYKQALGMLD